VKINPAGVITTPAAFRLLGEQGALGQYVWGPEISTRYFCKHCGARCFGRATLPSSAATSSRSTQHPR
jgi:hypothetical protein